MTRILAFADTQLGVSTLDLADQRDCLDRVVELAREHDVDVVLHGGDLFEGPVVTPEQLRVFLDATAPLRRRGIPIVVIRGNGRHDLAVRSVHALDILREIDGFYVSDRPERIELGELTVCTLPWTHPGQLLAQAEGDVDRERLNDYVAGLLVQIARKLLPNKPPAVLLAHWAISGSKLPVGLPVEEMREPVLPWASLDALGYDVVVGAHIHQPQQISQPLIDDTLGIVVGSPQQLNHGEHGEHGCWLLDLEAGAGGTAVSTEFLPIYSRRFVTVTVTVDDEGFHVESQSGQTEDAILRVRYQATEADLKRHPLEELRTFVSGELWPYRIQIEPQIERPQRIRMEGITEQLSPVDALSAYCDANEIEEQLALRMVTTLDEWSKQ